MSLATLSSNLSIRQKLVIGVCVIFLFMGAGIVCTFYWMGSLRVKIGNLEAISRFEESVLEMRRFEKNFFLYGDLQFLRTAQYNADRVKRLFKEHRQLFEGLSSPQAAHKFQQDLKEYEHLLLEHMHVSEEQNRGQPSVPRDEARIRRAGGAIAGFAEALAVSKRRSINETIQNTIELQLAGFALAVVGIAVMTGLMFAKVTKPLKLLEESTRRIAKGEFEPIEVVPMEKEVRHIFDSFNRMARDLKLGQEQLVQSKKLASLGTMLAGVAHEINNPLSNISSTSQLLLEELDDPDKEFQKNSLEVILEQVDKARVIVRTLLEFSRNREFRLEPTNLKELMEKTFVLIHGQIPPHVQIRTEIDDTIVVNVDRQRMQQALINLISNAVQAIDDEGTVEIVAMDGRDGMVDICIHDSGRGIPEGDLPSIFDPFFTTKDVGKGTGLGLFVTHDIVMSHKGTIKIDTALGQGTTIAVSIPSAGQ